MDKKLGNWWDHVTYRDAKNCIRENIQSLARDYIAIGFYLRRVRDGKLYLEDGYRNIHEFAREEFGMQKSTVNHCIRINAEFSEGGNSPVIDARYKEFGKTQLQELLYVPEEKRDEVTPDMTVAEIREIHKPERLDNEPGKNGVARLDNEPGQKEKEKEKPAKDSAVKDVPAAVGQEPEEKSQGRIKAPVAQQETPEIQEVAGEPIVQQHAEQKILESTRKCVTGWSRYGVCVCCGNGGVSCCDQCEESCNGRCGWIDDPYVPESEADSGTDLDVIDAEYQERPVRITVQDLLEQKRRELDEWLEAMREDSDANDAAVPGIVKLRIIVQALELLAGQNDSQERPENERGIRESVPGLDVEEIIAAIAKVRGVGKKALDDIRSRVEQLFRKGDTGVLIEMSRVQEQPPLPALKNNEQRKEWLSKYQEWGLWYEDGNIGAKYYRYRFENGAELIVEEYQDHSKYTGDFTTSYFHLVGGPEAPRKSHGLCGWQKHDRYNKFPNSETELVEFLKFVQKGDK